MPQGRHRTERKVLADLALNHPAAFKAVVDQVKYLHFRTMRKAGSKPAFFMGAMSESAVEDAPFGDGRRCVGRIQFQCSVVSGQGF